MAASGIGQKTGPEGVVVGEVAFALHNGRALVGLILPQSWATASAINRKGKRADGRQLGLGLC